MDGSDSDRVDDERVVRARRFFLSILRGDVEAGLGELAPDAEYHVPGRHRLSGTFRGRSEIGEHLHRLFELTAGDVDPVKWVDWMVGVDHVSVLVRTVMEAGHHRATGEHLFVVSFDPDGLIRRVRLFSEDPSDLDELFR